MSITTYESKAIERLPEGKGFFYADAAYKESSEYRRKVIQSLKKKQREVTEQELGIFDNKRRGFCEGFFGALTGSEIESFSD